MRKRGEPAKILPHGLRVGHLDTVGVIAPASNISREKLEIGCANLHRQGYKSEYSASILEKDLYFAGDHQRRAAELQQMFQRTDIAAIISARGGYGTNHLLPLIDIEVIRRNPKIFVGYSDITSLLTYFCDQADMVTFHGPMLVSDYAEAQIDSNGALNVPSPFHGVPEVSKGDSGEFRFGAGNPQPKTGTAQGVLYGGCLSMLAASLGTPYEIETTNTILFMEDVNTKPYQIDRMLMQLKYAGKFKDVTGFIFGEMQGCAQPGGQDYSLQDVVLRVLGDLNVPISFGLSSGHVSQPLNLTLPFGVAARLDVHESNAVLKFI